MSHDHHAEEEALIRRLTDRGIRTVRSCEWTRQGTLDAVREQRRRHAGDSRLKAVEGMATELADCLARVSGVRLDDIVMVLLLAGGQVGTFSFLHHLPGTMVSEILQVAGDELDRRAKAGEQP